MMAFDYKVIRYGIGNNSDANSPKQLEDKLKELGKDGWKVVASGGGGGSNGRLEEFLDVVIILMKED